MPSAALRRNSGFDVGHSLLAMAKPHGFRVVFRKAVGKTFRVEALGEYGHLELMVAGSDTIWIEPEFVEAVGNATQAI